MSAPYFRSILCGTAGLIALASARPVAAQSEQPAAVNSTGLEEIVVTARRVQEKLQDVPTAITAISTKELEQQQFERHFESGGRQPDRHLCRRCLSRS